MLKGLAGTVSAIVGPYNADPRMHYFVIGGVFDSRTTGRMVVSDATGTETSAICTYR